MTRFSIAMSVQQITTVLFAAAFARIVALCVIIAAPGYILNAPNLQKNKLLDIKESTIESKKTQHDMYYCNYCISQNLPFCTVTSSKLQMLNTNDSIILANKHMYKPSIAAANQQNPCNLCIECNTECVYCIDTFCPNQQRVCESCLTCNYSQIDELCHIMKVFNDVHKKLVSFIHFNIRSLSLHFDEFSNTVDRFYPYFDVIGLSETKLGMDSDLDKIQLKNYDFVSTNSNLSFGGTGIYINRSLPYTRLAD